MPLDSASPTPSARHVRIDRSVYADADDFALSFDVVQTAGACRCGPASADPAPDAPVRPETLGRLIVEVAAGAQVLETRGIGPDRGRQRRAALSDDDRDSACASGRTDRPRVGQPGNIDVAASRDLPGHGRTLKLRRASDLMPSRCRRPRDLQGRRTPDRLGTVQRRHLSGGRRRWPLLATRRWCGRRHGDVGPRSTHAARRARPSHDQSERGPSCA